jgi:signal transduction histidine kinase
MRPETLAALISYFALGANLLGIVFLLMIDPRSRTLRWFALFVLDIAVWLGIQGWILGRGEVGALAPLFEASVHMLPGLFLASALVDTRGWSDRRAALVVAVSLALLPISIGELIDTGDGPSPLVFAWQLFGWLTGAALHFRDRRSTADPGAGRRMRMAVLIVLMTMGPLAVVVGWFAGGDFFSFVMPLLTVGIQILIVFGVLHLRFYDVEVRAARSGELAARAGEIERLAVVGELAATVAHEVRNPLTGVRSLAQRLAEDGIDDDRRRRYAEVIVREVSRVEAIVSNLLGVARRRAAVPQAHVETPLDALFEDLALLVGGRAERAGIRVATDPRGLVAIAPREPLAQALLNLLLNAIDHSPAGGRVALEAREAESARDIVVRDQGPGVPAAQRERVFEPLVSTTGGNGLGLTVVRRLAAEHGWEVTIGEAPGGGAEFRIRVPSAPRSRVPVAEPA